MTESAVLSITDYDQAIATQESSEAFSKRAWAYFYIKDYDQALADIERAIALNPRSVEPYCVAASVRIARNEHFEAMECLTEALELTSPIDFRRRSIEEVMNGSKLARKLGANAPTAATTATAASGATAESAESTDSENTSSSETLHGEVVVDEIDGRSSAATADPNVPSPQNMVDLPFDDAEFMNLQKVKMSGFPEKQRIFHLFVRSLNTLK